MTNFKEIPRLYCGGFSQRSIEASLGRITASLYIRRLEGPDLRSRHSDKP